MENGLVLLLMLTFQETFERKIWEGEFLNRDFKFKRVQYSTDNRYEAKLMIGLLGLNNIRRYHLSRYFGDILNYCFIEFED